MTQLDLNYDASHVGSMAWQSLLEAFRQAVGHLGQKEVCFKLDVAKSTLSEALNERNDKRVAGEWITKVLAMLSFRGDERSAEIGRAMYSAQISLMPRFVLADADDMPTPAEVAYAKQLIAKAERRAA